MRRKTIKKKFWFSYDEDKQLKYLSSILNLSESNTIRKLLYETQVKESPPKEFYDAIYFCGVVKKGYLNKNPQKNNYPHNVHFAVIPCKGKSAVWNFEEWHVEIENGIILPIPSQEMLDEKFFRKPYDEHFYTCRIFRWMVGFYYPQMLYKNKD